MIPGDAHVIVVSDHGAQCMHGGIALNEWLVRQGYLVLQEPAKGPTRLEALKVDWARTTAWGAPGPPTASPCSGAGAEPPNGWG